MKGSFLKKQLICDLKGGFKVGGHEEVTDLEAEENKRALDFFANRLEVQTFGADLEDCEATLEDVTLKTQVRTLKFT